MQKLIDNLNRVNNKSLLNRVDDFLKYTSILFLCNKPNEGLFKFKTNATPLSYILSLHVTIFQNTHVYLTTFTILDTETS